MSKIYDDFLIELRNFRKVSTYKELAAKSGVSKSLINSYLNEGVVPTLEKAAKLLEVMNLELLIFDKIEGEN